MALFDYATLALCIHLLLGLIFLTAALGKLQHLEAFAGVLENYRLLPQWAIRPAQFGLPLLEIAVSLALLYSPRDSGFVAAGLLVIFAVAMGINLRRGRADIDCGCNQTALRQKLRWVLVWRNCALAALALAAAGSVVRPDILSMFVAAAASVALFVLYSTMNALWALGPAPQRSRIRIVGGSL